MMSYNDSLKQSIRWLLWSIHHRLDNIETMLQTIKRQEQREMATLADIKSRVEAEETVNQSAIALLQNISQMLKDAQASQDPAALQEIVDMLDANTTELSNAVTANTPAA